LKEFGILIFNFSLVLPIAESMKHPEKFTRVVNYGMLVVLFTFTLIGSLGYLALGEKVETNIFLNLPTNPAAASVQFFYAIAIMLSFPLMVYPAIRIIEGGLFGVIQTGKSSNLVKWEKNSFRAMLVILLGFTAWFGASNLDKVVALVGCLCCIPLSFIYPAMFHAQISKSKCIKYKDYAIVVFGIICTIYSTGITLQQFIVGSADIPLDRCAGVLL
jgi:proton-coupled amino acid transporter